MTKPPQRRRAVKEALEAYRARASELYVWSDADSPNEKKELLKALVAAKRSLLIDPKNYKTYVLIANICASLDSRETVHDALDFYNRAIAVNPDLPDAYAGKADLLMYHLRRPAQAEELSRRALKSSLRAKEPTELLELRFIGLSGILESREKFADARSVIRQALRHSKSEFIKEFAATALKRIAQLQEPSPLSH